MSLQTLLGLGEEPAVSCGLEHVIDPDVLADLVAQDGRLFSRILTDAAGGVLDVTELGCFPTEPLRRAPWLVEGVCDVPGGARPAESCDLDEPDTVRPRPS